MKTSFSLRWMIIGSSIWLFATFFKLETPCKPISAGRLKFVLNFRVLEALSKISAEFSHKLVDPVTNGF
jgi:hypothetical protein